MIKINLIKEEGKGRARIKMGLCLYVLSVVLVGTLGASGYASLASQLASLEERQEDLKEQQVSLQVKTKGINKLEEEKQKLREKLEIIGRLKKSKTGPVQVLDSINLSLPENAWLTDISEGGSGAMIIQGYAFNNEAISLFADDLAQSPFFPSVKIDEVSQAEYKDVKVSKFNLSLKVRFEGEPVAKEDGVSSANSVDRN